MARLSPQQRKSESSPEMEAVEGLLAQFEKLEAELDQVRQGLIHSHRLATLGTIASVIAHESNNILTPMTSYCQLALAQPENHELAQTAIRKSLEAADRLSRISSSLLGFSRERSKENDAPLRATISEAIQCMGREPEKDRIQLTVDVPDVVVSMPALNLQQVILNLLLNARKVMARTGGQIEIHGNHDDGWLQLHVSDSGPGIPHEIADHLFEPFVTVEIEGGYTDDQLATGTGLGLSICRDLVHQAGGTIEVDPTVESGATFILRLPVQS